VMQLSEIKSNLEEAKKKYSIIGIST